MSVTNARWIGTKENEKGWTVAYCTVCGGEERTIGDIRHTPDCLVPLVAKQAGIIVGLTEQVGELKAALAASEQRATMTTDAGLREAQENLVREWRFVIEREDQWRGFDDPEWERLWASVRENLATLDAALAPAAHRVPASAEAAE